MKYTFRIESANRHLIHVKCETDELLAGEHFIQLPSWRPGRYELGNFAKNITSWNITDIHGSKVISEKVTKDKWRIKINNASRLIISYHYYGAEINSGSSYADDMQLYINPVNLCVYLEGSIEEQCVVDIQVPDTYRIATCMKMNPEGLFITKDFHELADSPLIASADLKHAVFSVHDAKFNIWIQGQCNPDFIKMQEDFSKYTSAIFEAFGSFPFKEYHYLIQVLPHHFYHGVEHLQSTMITLGPGYKLMDHSVYDEVLGVCCHELYHSWNIKTIRPVELMPYNYTSENYTRLGYVAEGVTTYFGDLFLLRGKVFNSDQYLETLSERYQKHVDNPGRFNMAVSEASFDTWLDGYVPGVPNRKTSIYDEGCLTAFMTDILIRKHSNNINSLDTVMKTLYDAYGLVGKGYSVNDYKGLVEKYAGIDLSAFFNSYINGTEDSTKHFQECLDYLGLQIIEMVNPKAYERFGFRAVYDHSFFKVTHVIPSSPADNSGLAVNDRIVAFNGLELHHNLHELFAVQNPRQNINLSVFSQGYLKEIALKASSEKHYSKYKIIRKQQTSGFQKENYKTWCWEH